MSCRFCDDTGLIPYCNPSTGQQYPCADCKPPAAAGPESRYGYPTARDDLRVDASGPEPMPELDPLEHLTECAHAWEPGARLLGNVTALQLQSLCAELKRLRSDVPSPEDKRVLEALPPTFVLEMWCTDFPQYDYRHRIAVAELARRVSAVYALTKLKFTDSHKDT